MKLIFEKSISGRKSSLLPACDVPEVELDAAYQRQTELPLPELCETDVSRHYTQLSIHLSIEIGRAHV